MFDFWANQVVSCCVYNIPEILILQMHGNTPYMLDFWANQVVSCCVYNVPKKLILQMHDNPPYMFDFWANPDGHFILLKSSIVVGSFACKIECKSPKANA